MKRKKIGFGLSVGLLAAFILWTAMVRLVDVRQIGPQASAVGLAGINAYVHNLIGVNFTLYTITDWLGLIPVFICIGFGVLGLVQWIRRKRIGKVDFSILVLGGFYIITIATYLLFEHFVVNYRPVLINGYLEASYPSSTTMLTMCVMPTAAMQLHGRIQHRVFRLCVMIAIAVFIAFMVIGRVLSGVHWITDIIGGALFSAGLVSLYDSVNKYFS